MKWNTHYHYFHPVMLTTFHFRWMAQHGLILILLLFWPMTIFAEAPRQLPSNPHQTYPVDPTMSKGIIGVALNLSAHRVGDPAKLYVRAIHPEGPAAKAGIMHGDEIMAVDSTLLTGKTYEQIVGMIRGQIGDPVTLHVNGTQGDRTVSIQHISEATLMGQEKT
ncbi:MAG: PDZ domain-containing protein [Nitrospirales bacterium]|nr:PDZ domain-containing protein [Nitrospirales bacterium]